MFDIDDDDEQSWDEVREQYSIVIFHILSAASTLQPAVPESWTSTWSTIKTIIVSILRQELGKKGKTLNSDTFLALENVQIIANTLTAFV